MEYKVDAKSIRRELEFVIGLREFWKYFYPPYKYKLHKDSGEPQNSIAMKLTDLADSYTQYN